jgi:glyoxalase-like protein
VIDHVVLAVPDLADGVAAFHRLAGVHPVKGGSHTGLGTANHLVGLSDGAYLEIIGPDPDQPHPGRPRPFGIDDLTSSRIAAWCVRPPDLDRTIEAARAQGYDPGSPRVMSRSAPQGASLTWRLTSLPPDPADGLVPFLIDWGTTAHPTTAALPMLPLHSLEAEHPDPDRIRSRLAALDVNLVVRRGPRPRLLVTLQGANSLIALS